MRHPAADGRNPGVLRFGFGPIGMSASVNELLSTDEMAEADRLTIASGVAGIQLMENAGRAVADTVATRHRLGTPIAIVAGPGNNGGDGCSPAGVHRFDQSSCDPFDGTNEPGPEERVHHDVGPRQRLGRGRFNGPCESSRRLGRITGQSLAARQR